VKSEDTIFRELLERLDEQDRREVELRLEQWGDRAPEEPDPWIRFEVRFAALRWAAHTWDEHGPYQDLRRTFAAWLEDREDPRGEFVRLHHDIHELGECRASANPAELGVERAFLEDVLNHPHDETPVLIFADWLEEHHDPRADLIRLLARVRTLSRSLHPDWVEGFFFPLRRISSSGFACFDNSSRRVLMFANQEAQRLNHRYPGTQHILLALLREEFGIRTSTLAGIGLGPAGVRRVVERITPTGPDRVLLGKLPQSSRVRAALGFALHEADVLGADIVGPEFLLLGLCRVAPCMATGVLQNLGFSPATVCGRVLHQLGRDPLPWLRQHPEVW
jgi:uncharacterized protein (TIGR02996 family)